MLLPVSAFAGGADGVWKTESDKEGGYLYVNIGPCSSNSSNTCGTITEAFDASGKDPGYANLGKPIVMDMQVDASGEYSGGKIWDPQSNKTYKSKMSISGNTMTVKGCVGPICSGQKWTRVK
jgi:uncharacterized protein (DUF2147 family)